MSRVSTRDLYLSLCEEPARRTPPPRTQRRQGLSPRRARPRATTPEQDLAAVARLLGARVEQLSRRSRADDASLVRHEAMWLLYHGRALRTPAIGRLLDRDPASVRYGLLAVEARREADPDLTARLDQLLIALK